MLRSSQLPLFMATAIKEEKLVFVMLQTHKRQVIVTNSAPLEKDENSVSALSQRMLDNGYEMTSLYTDLANPTSNKIYKEIGCELIMESVLLFLESKH